MESLFYFIYSKQDIGHIERLRKKLYELGMETPSPDSFVSVGSDFATQIKVQISAAKVIVVFLTESSMHSEYCLREIEYAISIAENRDKIIFPVAQWGKYTLDNAPEKLKFYLSKYQIYNTDEDGLHTEEEYNRLATALLDLVMDCNSKELLYSQINAFRQIGFGEMVASKLSDLIVYLTNQIDDEREDKKRQQLYIEICNCLIELSKIGLSYGENSRNIARNIINSVWSIQKILRTDDFRRNDVLIVSIAIIMIKCMIDIWCDCIDTITTGDRHTPGSDAIKNYTSMHDMYITLYKQLIAKYHILRANPNGYSANEIDIIVLAEKYQKLHVRVEYRKEEIKLISEEEQKLWEIAEHIENSNRIFEIIGVKDCESQFFRCLKLSYERLLKFCEVADYKRVGAVCIERIEEIKQQLENYKEDVLSETTAEKAIRALLGLTVLDEKQYDVFISYKHEDIDIALNVYHYLQSNLLIPFLDKISLPEIAKSEYEDAIMNSLDNSKHFVVVISDLKYLNSHWIELEMKTFRHEIVEGRKQNSNFIIIVTDDVYKIIVETNKNCIDIKYRSYEIMTLSMYKELIINYLKK